MNIGDLIEVPPVRTVIKLEEGKHDSQAIAGSFVFTSEVRSHFAVLSEALLKKTGRGYFLQGDFGSGKSHFLAALSAWFKANPGHEVLTRNHPGLERLKATGRRFLSVDISLINYRSTTALEQILISEIQNALSAAGLKVFLTPLANFLQYFKEILNAPKLLDDFTSSQGIKPQSLDSWLAQQPRQAYVAGVQFLKKQGFKIPEVLVEERHETFSRTMDAVREGGFDGLILLIDELSEFFRSKSGSSALNEDARTLQFLGELTGTQPLWILSAIQESIERTGDIAQVTFRKIKDRFPVRFRLSTLHIQDLISKRLVRRKPGADEQIHHIYEKYKSHFPTFSCEFDHFRNIYPLHPSTLALLEGLGELFSQHRGIVDFVHSHLIGDSSRHIDGILDRPCMELLAPDSIYEHFQSRLAEFSAFNIYPRHIVPHLDEIIGQVIEETADRTLARRLIRILVLYKVHPTADPPNVRVLAELTACMLAPHDPDLNTQFVAEALLDPLVQMSRFLVRKKGKTDDPLDLVYTIVTKDDPGKILKARIAQVAGELTDKDSRLITEPLAELNESVSWPGPDICRGILTRTLTWRQSTRRVILAFISDIMETTLQDQIGVMLRSGDADFAVLVGFQDVKFQCDYTAVWKIPFPQNEGEILREFLAARMVMAQLRPSNPADAPLLPLIQDTLKRLEPAVRQVLVNLIYQGDFNDPHIQLEAVVRQLRRFDRLMETAGEYILEIRYPKFKEIAPTVIFPSPRLYMRLLDEFIIPGSLTLQEARTKGLTEAVESLAVPLGLAELHAGSYILSPDPVRHAFLAYVFSLFHSSRETPLADVLFQLKTGPYGLPKETAGFLLTTLAHCGIISLMRNGRGVPLDFLDMNLIEKIDTIAPGEIISQADRETLLGECSFLAMGQGWSSFGLRQQREAWQAVIKFKKKKQDSIDELEKGLVATAEYSALQSFNTQSLRAKLSTLQTVLNEIKVSYSAREGLERFLGAWRTSGLLDITFLKQTHKFFTGFVDQFIFICHYMRQRSVENAVFRDEHLLEYQRTISEFLHKPDILVVNDNGAELASIFAHFRESYLEYYRKQHTAYYRKKDKLSKFAQRGAAVLRKLAAIESLDRPPGLGNLLSEIDAPVLPSCKRNLAEELLRSAACGCGFQIGDEPQRPRLVNPAEAIENNLTAYLDILKNPQVLEAVTTRIYALKDMDPNASKSLRNFCDALKHCDNAGSVILLDILNEQTIFELARALTGNMTVEERSLNRLISQLSGRRLSRGKITRIVEEWMASVKEETILSIVEDIPSSSASAYPSPIWWPLLHSGFRLGEPLDCQESELRVLEAVLEEKYPAAKLQPQLLNLDNEKLVQFLVEESCHTRAIQTAWLILAERILKHPNGSIDVPIESRHLSPSQAAGIKGRLEKLKRLSSFSSLPFPERLRIRLAISEILFDPWTTDRLQLLAGKAINEISQAAEDWLTTLPPLSPLDLTDSPVVILMEAVSPDVWMEANVHSSITDGASQTWQRLDTTPKTLPSLMAIFGFTNDPSDEFAARGILYHHLEGNEPQSLIDLLPPFDIKSAVVIRLATLDRAAHGKGNIKLCDMPGIVQNILERHLPPILHRCSQQKRRLILTTDHGLTLTKKGLSHGSGGVYERAIFRAEWGIEM